MALGRLISPSVPQGNGGNNETYFPESLQGLSEIILCEPPRTALATLTSTRKKMSYYYYHYSKFMKITKDGAV